MTDQLKVPRDQEAGKADKGKSIPAGLAGCAVATLPERVPQLGKNADRRVPSPRRGHRGDQEVFQDRPQHKGTLGCPSHTRGKGKGKSKGKGKGNLLQQTRHKAAYMGELVQHFRIFTNRNITNRKPRQISKNKIVGWALKQPRSSRNRATCRD